jgi:Ca-activated chloride channel family protein
MNVLRTRARFAAAADLVALVYLLLCSALALALVVGASVLLLAGEANAQDAIPMKPSEGGTTPMKPGEVQSGTLLLKSQAGTFAVPLLHTDVTFRVSGMVARASVKQTFRNPREEWFEGIYVFPLPENAAVDHLRMTLGERVVEGEIRERGQAKREYTQAKQSGQRAALLEQERPNLFTSSVANIGPGQEVVVELEYQQTLRYDAGRYSLRFPMVVGPRYIPGSPVAASKGTGWAPDTTRVSDASRITPPVLHPRNGPINPVSLRVELDAGVPLASVESPYHRVNTRVVDYRKQVIDLEQGTVPANRDFELAWTPTAESAPRVAWFTEQRGDRHFGLLMLVPPAAAAAKETRIPREAIFVIDTSGSMSGASIAQAREALELAIERLSPGDSFNVIEFNSYAKALFEAARPATRDNHAEARGWVRGLRAQGGTEMALALNLALDSREHPERIRQVVFLTDGAVGNEEELFRLIKAKLGDSRLFTVGIGSAPNSHFMTKAAELGRGTFTYIGRIEEVREKMSGLFGKLESPVLKGVKIDWPAGARAESWPKRLPDLYAGEPLVVTASLERLDGKLKVSGLRGDAPWEAEVALDRPAAGAGMGVLWARDKIVALTDSMREGTTEEQARSEIIDVALAHHLVTKYTSLVAIDRTPVRPEDMGLKTAALPTNLPDGWNYEAVFGGAVAGELPQGATDSYYQLLVGLLMMLLATFTLRIARPMRVRL